MLRLRKLLPVLAALACSPPALAAQLAVNFQARVDIQTSCTVTASQLNFGAVGIINGGEPAVSTINVVCSAGTPYTLSFNPFASVTSYNGSMVNGVNSVAYSANLSAAGGIGPNTHTIDGALAVQTTPPSALYTDNRTLYLNY